MNQMLKEKAGALPKILRKGIYRNNIENENGLEVARLGLFAIVGDEDPAAEALRDAIVDRYNAPALVCQVEVRNVFGNEMIYPANQAAELFAALAGKKTLSRADLQKIEGLGFAVEEVTPKKLAA